MSLDVVVFLTASVAYWFVFIWLLRRRNWSTTAFFVGALHLLFAMAASVAPYNALAERASFHWQVGLIGFSSRAAALPAILLIAWALGAAYLAALQKRGRWLWLVVIGDGFWALDISARMALDLYRGRSLSEDTIQFGEHLTIAGPLALTIMVLVLVIPFIASALWSARRVTAPA